MQKHCSVSCYYADENKRPRIKTYEKIKPRSKKRAAQESVYSQLKKAFLSKPENATCPVTGKPTTDVHHMKGRVGSLLTDTTYWLAVSREGHRIIEENPEWAYKKGYSIRRN